MTTGSDLARLSLFAGIDPERLEPLARVAGQRHVTDGEVLFREGGSASQVYVLVEGRVSIQVSLTSRPEQLTVSSLSQPGQLIGWSGLMAPANYSASAVCTANSHLLTFDSAQFQAALEADPAVGLEIMHRIAQVISGRLRNIQRVVLKTL